MIWTKRKKPPRSFIRWVRDNPGESWRALDSEVKHELRRALWEDQDGLCCYCYNAIHLDTDLSVIEHIEPQADDSDGVFEWFNLALACAGGKDRKGIRHCDHSKDDTTLNAVHPYRNPVTRVVRLRVHTGKLAVHPTNDAVEKDVLTTLNLNEAELTRARFNRLQAVQTQLNVGSTRRRGRLPPSWSARQLDQILEDLNARPQQRFAPLIREWVERQRRARG